MILFAISLYLGTLLWCQISFLSLRACEIGPTKVTTIVPDLPSRASVKGAFYWEFSHIGNIQSMSIYFSWFLKQPSTPNQLQMGPVWSSSWSARYSLCMIFLHVGPSHTATLQNLQPDGSIFQCFFSFWAIATWNSTHKLMSGCENYA